MYSEIEELYRRSLEGEIDAKEELLFRLKPAILSSIKSYYNRYDQYDDLLQEGYEVILRCIEDYDRTKDVHFLGYVKLMLRFHYLNKHKITESTASLNQEMYADDGIELIDTLADNALSQEELIIKSEEMYLLCTSLLKLTDRQREVVILYYIEEKSLQVVSAKFGISYRTVVNTKTTAINKLRKLMKNSFE